MFAVGKVGMLALVCVATVISAQVTLRGHVKVALAPLAPDWRRRQYKGRHWAK